MKKTVHFDVLILGAGFSGLVCGVACARQGYSVCLVEKMPKPGIKLLLTGGGRCNLSHDGEIATLLPCYGKGKNFVKRILFSYTNQRLRNFFREIQVPTIVTNELRIFPESEKSRDVQHALIKAFRAYGGKLYTSSPIRAVQKKDDCFVAFGVKNLYYGQKLIIATGGKSYSHTGSTGDGYIWAKTFGHTIIPIKPGLTPIIVRDYQWSDCAGISLKDRKIRVYRNGKRILDYRGDILFTHRGLSGPGILDVSADLRTDDEVCIGVIDAQEEEIFKQISSSSMRKRTLRTWLHNRGLSFKFIDLLLRNINLNPSMRFHQLNRFQRDQFVSACTRLPFLVARTANFSQAMITRGGVSHKELSSKTMESRLVPGLYFIGEIVDVDGKTGGYNLQFAFSSALAAAYNIR